MLQSCQALDVCYVMELLFALPATPCNRALDSHSKTKACCLPMGATWVLQLAEGALKVRYSYLWPMVCAGRGRMGPCGLLTCPWHRMRIGRQAVRLHLHVQRAVSSSQNTLLGPAAGVSSVLSWQQLAGKDWHQRQAVGRSSLGSPRPGPLPHSWSQPQQCRPRSLQAHH